MVLFVFDQSALTHKASRLLHLEIVRYFSNHLDAVQRERAIDIYTFVSFSLSSRCDMYTLIFPSRYYSGEKS